MSSRSNGRFGHLQPPTLGKSRKQNPRYSGCISYRPRTGWRSTVNRPSPDRVSVGRGRIPAVTWPRWTRRQDSRGWHDPAARTAPVPAEPAVVDFFIASLELLDIAVHVDQGSVDQIPPAAGSWAAAGRCTAVRCVPRDRAARRRHWRPRRPRPSPARASLPHVGEFAKVRPGLLFGAEI